MKIVQTSFKYTNALIPLILNNVKYILIHHTAIQTATPEDIHKWHLANSWAGFGYNEYIRKDGTVYIGRGDNVGAQCTAMNSKSYGICCEGDFDIETTMSDDQFKSLVERVNVNKLRFDNFMSVEPHSKFFATSCPGSHFPMSKLLSCINSSPKPTIASSISTTNSTISSTTSSTASSPASTTTSANTSTNTTSVFPNVTASSATTNSPVATNLKDDISVLVKNGIIKMPEYWMEYAVSGKVVKGENIAALLHNFAEKLRSN